MVARMGEREESLMVWIRSARADGRLKPLDPDFAAQQLHGMLKAFAFWPQITMNQPPSRKTNSGASSSPRWTCSWPAIKPDPFPPVAPTRGSAGCLDLHQALCNGRLRTLVPLNGLQGH